MYMIYATTNYIYNVYVFVYIYIYIFILLYFLYIYIMYLYMKEDKLNYPKNSHTLLFAYFA